MHGHHAGTQKLTRLSVSNIDKQGMWVKRCIHSQLQICNEQRTLCPSACSFFSMRSSSCILPLSLMSSSGGGYMMLCSNGPVMRSGWFAFFLRSLASAVCTQAIATACTINRGGSKL